MGPLHRLFRLAIRRPETIAADVDDEIGLHLDLRTAELVAAGWSPEQARAEAERLFGNPAAHRRQCTTIDQDHRNSMRRSDLIDTLRQDIAFSLRAFRRRPLFTAAAIAILALGIGANTAVFSIVHGVLLRPLPFDTPDRLVMLRNRDPDGEFGVSELERIRYGQETALFSSLGAWAFGTLTTSGSGDAERVRVMFADANALPTAGIQPALGRLFTAEEDRPGADQVALISHNYWRTRLGETADVLGRTLTLNGEPRVVIGVLPPEARLPGDFTGPRAELIVPLAPDPVPDPRNFHFLTAMARLRPGVTLEAANARFAAVARELVETVPPLPDDYTVEVYPVAEEVTGQFRPAVLMLLWAVGLLLLLACANVAGLLLAHAESRRREFAVRAALGAAPGRLARQVVTESLMLGGLGGLVGTLLGYLAIRGLLAVSPPGLPRVNEVSLNPVVLVFAVGASLLTALLFGLAPALTVRRREGQALLRGEGRGSTAGRERHLVRRGLVFAEITLAVMLASGAGLVVRTWLNVVRTDPGFGVDQLLTFQLSLPGTPDPDREQRWRFYQNVVAELAQLPGVRAAGGVSALPLAQEAGDWGFRIEGRPPAPEGERHPFADRIIVTPGYFEAMRVPLREGRLLSAGDDAASEPVVLLNQAVARRYWPEGNALGARIRLSSNVDTLWRRVVGIVGDIRSRGLEADVRQEFYFPHAQYPTSPTEDAMGTLSLVLHTTGNPEAFAGSAREAVRRLDAGIPLSQVRTMDNVLGTTLSVRRLQLLLLSFFAVSGLLLVAAGVYGVVASLVSERSREFGVRLALGADRGSILRMVLGDGARMAALGAVAGVFGAIVLGHLLRSVLYGVKPRDPVVLVLVPLLVLLVVLVATFGPARRAAATDPGPTLRAE
ncbi:MAG TPA: ABC transporter permease [Gemmatimonadales bacterium]